MRQEPVEIPAIVADLLPALQAMCQVPRYGIAFGGAHAKGVADSASDLDLYVFAAAIASNEARTQRVVELADAAPRSWSMPGAFTQAGTDFICRGQRVEVWLRSTGLIEQTLAECERGIVKQDLVTWTVMGFYNHCALSDLAHMFVLDDADGMLAAWQRRVSVYPPRLRVSIIEKHLMAARFWPHNPHYASAVERCDVLYVSGIVQQVVHNLVQVLFALNRVYFPGDKKLAAALDALQHAPPQIGTRMSALIAPAVQPTVASLTVQRHALQTLAAEVEALTGRL